MHTRITPSLVLSIIALVLSLTGVGYAATQLPRDSVGSAQIRAGAVGSAEVADGSLRPADFSDAAKDALEGRRGARGAKGDTGATGPAGPAGPQGPAGASSASGSGGGLTVTDATGVVVGALVDVNLNSSYSMLLIQRPDGTIVQYRDWNTGGPVRSDGWTAVSLTADCAPPYYIAAAVAEAQSLARMARPVVANSTTVYTVADAVAIARDAGSPVYYTADCSSQPGDWLDSSYKRLEPVAAPAPALTGPFTLG